MKECCSKIKNRCQFHYQRSVDILFLWTCMLHNVNLIVNACHFYGYDTPRFFSCDSFNPDVSPFSLRPKHGNTTVVHDVEHFLRDMPFALTLGDRDADLSLRSHRRIGQRGSSFCWRPRTIELCRPVCVPPDEDDEEGHGHRCTQTELAEHYQILWKRNGGRHIGWDHREWPRRLRRINL